MRVDRPALPFIGIVKENVGTEIENFRPFMRGADIYVDPKLSFFKALDAKKASIFSLLTLSFFKIWNRAPSDVPHNQVGEGLRLGGLYIFGPGDQGLVFAHREERVGNEADVDQVRAAINMLPLPDSKK